ncbi:MAG: class E sortase [Candidatus Andersenbacteria bacterium]|nr:class E sortase [Candidatus Andersenbacteria bacterium]MBI3250475.1 class E sortase [Candidatus Andersenbacteria bacterium]
MKTFPLFLAVFGFASLFFFGLGVVALMVTPVVASLTVGKEAYQPLLPVSEAREEGFLDVKENPGKQMYPALTTEGQSLPQTNRIVIPALDVDVPIIMSPSLEDVDVIATLNEGAALYPNGVLPGHLGNLFISAHSTGEPWKGKYRFAFLRINELQPGNVLHIDYNGTRYTYTMTDQEIVTPTPDYRVVSDRPVPTLSLMACWPIWSTQKRMLIHADLTNVTKLTQRPA